MGSRRRLILQSVSKLHDRNIRFFIASTPDILIATRKSPFSVLQIEANASKDDIKAAFRKLVKIYHPDLNPSINSAWSTVKMTEITEAYDLLMDEDYSTRWGDNSVAMACEIYTLQELKASPAFQVHAIRIMYSNEAKEYSSLPIIPDHQSLHSETLVQILTDPHDSVSDLKRTIQAMKYAEWGLQGRALDRDKVARGWDIGVRNTDTDAANLDSLTVLSYHLFLHSYNIQHGDIIYAILKI